MSESSPHRKPSPECRSWAGGRVLSTAQRERKRAANRLSSRKKRSQLLIRIEELEAEVGNLKSRCFCQQQQAVNVCLPLNTHHCCVSNLANLNYESPVGHPSEPHNNNNNDNSLMALATSCQQIFNHVLTSARSISRFEICSDDATNQAILVRALVNGWDGISGCPLWDLLRYLDKRIFRMSSFITRLCTLRMIHLMLLCMVGATPFSELPAWYKPRPSQYKFQHPLAVDVLPWPGLRERAVHSPAITEDNHFWAGIIYLFRFHWPFDRTEAVSFNTKTGTFALSGLFQNYVRDISMWKVDLEFFSTFPDLFDDIVPTDSIERPLSSVFGLPKMDTYAAMLPALPLPEETTYDHDQEILSLGPDSAAQVPPMIRW